MEQKRVCDLNCPNWEIDNCLQGFSVRALQFFFK